LKPAIAVGGSIVNCEAVIPAIAVGFIWAICVGVKFISCVGINWLILLGSSCAMFVGICMPPVAGIAVAAACIAERNPFEHAIFCSFDNASNFFIMSSGFAVLSSDASEHVVVVGVNIDVPPAGICMPPGAPPVLGIDPPVGMADSPVPTSEAFDEHPG